MLTQWCEGGPSSGFMVIRKLQKFSAPGARNSDLQAPPPPPRVNACLLARRHIGHSVMAGFTPMSWLETNTNYHEYHCDPLPVLKAYPESCLFILALCRSEVGSRSRTTPSGSKGLQKWAFHTQTCLRFEGELPTLDNL